MLRTLIMSAKMATLGFLKISYLDHVHLDYVYDVTNKNITRLKLHCRCGNVKNIW